MRVAFAYSVLAGAALSLSVFALQAYAASIAGRLAYPSEELPAMVVVAREIGTGKSYTTKTARGQARYRIDVPAGRYEVFAAPIGAGDESLRGAHTTYSICGRDKAQLQAGRCQTGPLVEVRLDQRDARTNIDIDDWYLPDALMTTLVLPSGARAAPAR